jgi:hypothetical protein
MRVLYPTFIAPSRCDPLPHSRPHPHLRPWNPALAPYAWPSFPSKLCNTPRSCGTGSRAQGGSSYTGGRAYTQSIEDASFRRRVVPSRLSGTELEGTHEGLGLGLQAVSRNWEGKASGTSLIKIDDFNARAGCRCISGAAFAHGLGGEREYAGMRGGRSQ